MYRNIPKHSRNSNQLIQKTVLTPRAVKATLLFFGLTVHFQTGEEAEKEGIKPGHKHVSKPSPTSKNKTVNEQIPENHKNFIDSHLMYHRKEPPMVNILNAIGQTLKTFLDGFISLLSIVNPLLNLGTATLAGYIALKLIRLIKKSR